MSKVRETSSVSQWCRAIDWQTVLAAGLPAWFVILGIVVWFKVVPKNEWAAVHVTVGLSELPNEPELPETAPRPRASREESPWPRLIREVAQRPRLVIEEAPQPQLVRELPDLGQAILAALVQNLAQPRPGAKVVEKAIPEGCKTHGTAIHFTKSTLEAIKRAKATDKLVFVLHLSGNIEDDGFT